MQLTVKSEVYLYLFHGRSEPAQDMDGWGECGPFLGPFPFVHIACGHHIKLGTSERDELFIDSNGLIFYDGMYYGDYSITTTIDETKVAEYIATKAIPPMVNAGDRIHSAPAA